MIGRTISNYRIIDRLAHGGLDEAYVAVDLEHKRKIALEVVPTERLSAEALRRLRGDARVLAELAHPNIATPYSVERAEIGGDEPRTLELLARELVDGASLDLRIPAGGLPAERFVVIARPLVDGLAAAHRAGVGHLGLSPESVVVTPEGEVKILDFALVGARHELAAEASLQADRLPYLAPEQLDGRPVDLRADVFALGAILYELAVGSRAFPGASGPEAGVPALREPPPAITATRPDLPPAVEAIVGRCLESDPEKRYIDAGGLIEPFAQLVADVAERRRRAEREAAAAAAAASRERARARRGPIAAIVGAALLLILAAVWLLTRDRAPVEERVEDGVAVAVAAAPGPEVRPLLILPFDGADEPEDDFFAAGMSAEIGRRVASVGAVPVIAHRAAVRYDRTEKEVAEIGRDLGATHVLAGRVTRGARGAEKAEAEGSESEPGGESATDAPRLRIETELIRAADGDVLWRQLYEGPAESVSALQASIAARVIERLGHPLPDPAPPLLRGQPTADRDAHAEYLRALAALARPDEGPEALLAAVEHLERAVEIDPGFALAHARLAEAHSVLIERTRKPEKHLLQADIAAFRARELAPGHPRARLAMAGYFARRSDFVRALEEATLAERDLAGDAEVARVVSRILRSRGDFAAAAKRLREGLRTSRRDPELTLELADTLRWMRRYEEADALLRDAIESSPESEAAHLLLARNLLAWRGDAAAARQALAAIDRPLDPASHLARVEAALLDGDHRAALRHLAAAKTWFSPEEGAYTPKALWESWIHLLAGRAEQARAANRTARFELEERVEKDTRNARVRSSLGWAYAGRGLTDAAIREGRLGARLITISQDAVRGSRQVLDLARIYALVGDAEAAGGELSLLLGIPGEISPALLRIDPVWDRVRDHAAFRRLLEEAAGSAGVGVPSGPGPEDESRISQQVEEA